MKSEPVSCFKDKVDILNLYAIWKQILLTQ